MLPVCAAATVHGADPLETRGRVDAVTVYRGQAYVARVIDVPGPAGLKEVVVTDLPEHVVPGSLHAESADGVEVRSVRYRIRPVGKDVREEVRLIEDQLQVIEDRLEITRRRHDLLGEQKAYLDSLQTFIAPTASTELTKGVLNAETLKSLTAFSFEQRTQLAEAELEIKREQRSLFAQRDLLNRERNVLTTSSTRTGREAVVFINLTGNDGGALRLRYLVDHATWSPSYAVRADQRTDELTLDYFASVHQMSGEDWSDVSMTLSTATPSLVSKAPFLSPLTVSLAAVTRPMGALEAERRELRMSRDEAYSRRASRGVRQQQAAAPSTGMDSDDYDQLLNVAAAELQILDLIARESKSRLTRRVSDGAEESVSVTYQVDSRTSLPSRADRQLIQIASLHVPAEFYKLAIPVLTEFIYNEAFVTNRSDLVLLAGPVSTYVNGEFVGQGDIPAAAAGESFTVGLGIDPTLRASRELAAKTETQKGGNRIVNFAYTMSIANFGTAPAAVRLLDRLPTPKGADVRVTRGVMSHPLSDDSYYMHSDLNKGILRWDVTVPVGANGLEAMEVEYEFSMEYDRQLTLTVASAG